MAECPYMLYADDAGIVSKSAEGLAKMMTVIVTDVVALFEAADVGVSEQKTNTTLLVRTQEAPNIPCYTACDRSRWQKA